MMSCNLDLTPVVNVIKFLCMFMTVVIKFHFETAGYNKCGFGSWHARTDKTNRSATVASKPNELTSYS